MAFTLVSATIGVQTLNGYDSILNSEIGQQVLAFDPVYGQATLEYMACPTSTALPAGMLVTKVATALTSVPTPEGNSVTLSSAPVATPMPTNSANSAQPVYVVVNALASSTTRQFGWFMCQGQFPVLKTAVRVSPASRVWISGTAGRFYQTSSAGKTIVGIRSANLTTALSTVSTVLCNVATPMIQGS
jgi:hypothetical protein